MKYSSKKLEDINDEIDRIRDTRDTEHSRINDTYQPQLNALFKAERKEEKRLHEERLASIDAGPNHWKLEKMRERSLDRNLKLFFWDLSDSGFHFDDLVDDHRLSEEMSKEVAKLLVNKYNFLRRNVT